MTDEEVIAHELGDVEGAKFLYWDRVIRNLETDGAPPSPSLFATQRQRILEAHRVIDRRLNETTDRWDNRERIR